ncbi:MAG: hypothetical protein JO338_11625 [Aquitalea sp.]|nr:hypothetical protein [Aquitalea sp.]
MGLSNTREKESDYNAALEGEGKVVRSGSAGWRTIPLAQVSAKQAVQRGKAARLAIPPCHGITDPSRSRLHDKPHPKIPFANNTATGPIQCCFYSTFSCITPLKQYGIVACCFCLQFSGFFFTLNDFPAIWS